MILYTILLIIYVVMILYIKPAPSSFRGAKLTTKENFFAIKGSLFLGVIIMSIHLFVSGFTFLDANENIYVFFALNNLEDNPIWMMQFVTHNFIHFNLLHLIGNITMLGILSVYERKVGLTRYLAVFIISGIASGFSLFLYSENIYSSGVSGALFGLAAAFFTDEKDLALKDWLYAIFVFFILFVVVSITDFYEMQKINNINFSVDYIAHILGAVGAIVYTRVKKRA